MIRIYPIDHLGRAALPEPDAGFDPATLWGERDRLFFENGKRAIRYLMRHFDLQRGDEVCILTSSESTYVSTCVSATIFNYATISRVPSERTRMIYVIHEFGLPHPRIAELAELARSRSIPLVEDCAHGLDSRLNGKPVGSFGDFTVYSLAKHLPMSAGGMLTGEGLSTANSEYSPEVAAPVEAEFDRLIAYLPALSAARKRIFHHLHQALPELDVAFDCDDSWTPYFVMFDTPLYNRLYSAAEGRAAELGRTHVPGWLAVPTQPLASDEEIAVLIETLRAAA
jgi:hypothetical protein